MVNKMGVRIREKPGSVAVWVWKGILELSPTQLEAQSSMLGPLHSSLNKWIHISKLREGEQYRVRKR